MMQSKLSVLLGSLALLLASALPGRAAAPASQPYVVLVGISHYADPQILPRPHAEADAKALYDLCTNKEYLGVDADHVRLLLGQKDPKRPGEVATRENVLNALRWATGKAETNDLVVFAFVGQGAPLDDKDCYFTTDSTYKDRAKNAIGAGDIEGVLTKLKSHRFCAFLDANFKGFKPEANQPAPEATLANFYREFFKRSKEDHTSSAGRVVFLANVRLKPSMDLKDHGLFTQVLLDGLKGGADKEGDEADGVVTVDELEDYVRKEIADRARNIGKTRDEKDQEGWILGGQTDHFVLTHNPSAQAKVDEQLQKFARLAEDKQLAEDITKEGKKLLARMPKLKSQRLLRKEYQRLVEGGVAVDKFLQDRERIVKSTVLSREDAEEYAAKVINASEVILKEYVKQTKQADLIVAAVKGIYQRIDEKIPGDLQERLTKSKELDEKELTTLLADVREHLGKRSDLENHKDIDYALQQMMAPLDPYTTYIDPETLSQFKRETSGNFVGIGVQIRVDTVKDMPVVITPIKGSPAYKKGVKTGDVIAKITREVDKQGQPIDPPDVISTKGLPVSEVVSKIAGKEGTPVKISVIREGEDELVEFEITRGPVQVESVMGAHRQLNDSWDFMLDPDSKIAYIRLTSFARNSYRDLKQGLETLKRTGGIKGLILDLRFNPGGLLTSAVDISDLFIEDGLIVTIRPRAGHETPYRKEHEESYLDFPMVCLVNGHSASGSEIVSACLQDHRRALILGERSYGKGSVQNIQPFEEGELKLTTASFWRPSGKNLNKSSTNGKEDAVWGVVPDKTVKLSPKERDQLEEHLRKLDIIPRRDLPAKEKDTDQKFEDKQLGAAVKYLREQIELASSAPTKKAG